MLENQKLERERLARIANAGPFDILDENGYPILSNWEAHLKQKAEHKPKKLRRKSKTKDKSVKKWKPGKKGQLKAGWPHQIGLEMLMLLLNIPHPDEEFLSKAAAYFDVQASALYEIVHKVLDLNNGNAELPSSLDEMIAMGCLSFCVWIAKNVIGPADLIEDVDVDECLAWQGELPPKKKPKKGKKKKKGKRKTKKGKNKVKKCSKKIKNKGKKVCKSKKKRNEEETSKQLGIEHEEGENEEINEEEEFAEDESISQDPFQNLKQTFLTMVLPYNLQVPEFVTNNEPPPAEKIVEFVIFFENLMWKFPSLDDFDLQPLTPNPVPKFFPRSRPHCCKEATPWYIKTDPNSYADVKSEWDTAYTYETIEMIANLIKSLISTPKFTVKRMLELVAEICDAIERNDVDNLTSPELDLLDSKRTIIFERIFIKFFGKKFRDYDSKTRGYMETICHRAAVLVRQLYQHTSKQLWEYQRSPAPRPPTPEPVVVEEPFDEEMFNNWNTWVEFLLRATRDARTWQNWLLEITKNENLPDDRSILREEAEKWLELGDNTQAEANEFKAKAEFLEPVKVPIDFLESRFEEMDEESDEFKDNLELSVLNLEGGFDDDMESIEDG